ncbi:hypothetical protein [Terracoccus sp. 273MFTsu3.1]|uniref:hypothetical protein n=1 Tax=Terracoccus sp. 273MFTsu3.1 TaxID=1172188 RepID=UPI000364A31A|nr:hypothetical protein [Terracoccus sp. 273MFTsu3.1]
MDRRNAVAWLSRGLITPSSVMPKYRHDVLESAPDLLPLASEEAVGVLASSARFPLAVEVDAGVARQLDELETTPSVLWFRGAIPATRILRIHVPSAADLEELLARAYRGFAWTELKAHVSPDLFEARSVVEPPPTVTPLPDGRRLRLREAISGALVSAASAELIDRFLGVQGESAEVDELALLVDTALSFGLVEGGDDRALLSASLECIFDQTEAGDLVASQLVDQLAQKAESAGQEALAPYFVRMLQLLHGEDELRPFHRRGGLLTPKALLLYLLRPDPKAVTRWSDEGLNVEPEVQRLAQLLAGFGSRYGGLPTELRGTDHSNGLMDWTADGLVDPHLAAPGHSTRDLVTTDLGLRDVASRYRESLQRELAAEVLAGDSARALRISQALLWNDCLTLAVVSRSFEASREGHEMRLTFAPGAKVEWELIPPTFLDHLAATHDAELARALRE